MKTNDARRLDHKTLTELRKRAVRSIHAGQSPEIVAQALGIGRATMYGWLSRYRNGGWGSLDARKRGGRPCKLDGKSMQWIYRTVTMKNPMQLKFTFALWTAKMIGQVIYQRFGIKLSKASVCRLLSQLGLTPQRPVWRAYQQKPEAVQKWLDEEDPPIRALAKRQKAKVFITVLRRLLHNADTPIFLIVDGHPAHKAVVVRKFVESVGGRLRLFFL